MGKRLLGILFWLAVLKKYFVSFHTKTTKKFLLRVYIIMFLDEYIFFKCIQTN